jgi:hypothetical protein
LIRRVLSHLDGYSVLFGGIAIAAFWFAIQLCWSMAGKQWYGVAWRVLAVVGLLSLGAVMIFFSAFGTE